MKKFLYLILIANICLIPCFAQITESTKVDDLANAQCDDYLGRTMDFANRLKQSPDAKGFVIIYEGKTAKNLYDKNADCCGTDGDVFPRFGLANELIKTMKQRFFLLRVDESKLSFVKGGFREKLSVELWITSKQAEPPQITHTLKKMRYRKGKPRGYCITI